MSATANAKKKPTQADVAKRAAVSQALVSYVLNESQAVSVPVNTRRRVLDAVADLGYVPNRAARSLRTRKTYTIAAIIPDITNPFYPALERGIQNVAEANGYDLIAYNTDGVREKERKCLEWVLQGRVDGIVMVPFGIRPEELLPVLQAGVSVVAIGMSATAIGDLPIDSLGIDDVRGGREAVDYLFAQGHDRIGMIAGEAGTPPRERRVAGYRAALAARQIPLDEILIRAADFTEEGGYAGMRDLLKLDPRPSAVFAANDLMAIGALITLREAGLQVPRDMAVVGFDDIPAARFVTPALTTVAQFPERQGRRAAEILIERLTGAAPVTGRFQPMEHKLIIRDSA